MYRNLRKHSALFLTGVLLLNTFSPMTVPASEASPLTETAGEGRTDVRQIIRIRTAADLADLAQHCVLDTWSENVTVLLENDIDLAGSGFVSIPCFSGIFDGQGHTIRGLSLREDGSRIGFFRYLTRDAIIRSLIVEGSIEAPEKGFIIGGIAASNRGLISNCCFEGSLSAQENIGGIAGVNEAEGIIASCSAYGSFQGAHMTGGIAGSNNGKILSCLNAGEVNTILTETSESTKLNLSGSLTDFDISTLGSTEEFIDIMNTGGIAGASDGLIDNCVNAGTVGYARTGYNVGGIAGINTGYLTYCRNDGRVYGRKDIGGITGQNEPETVWEYSTEKMDDLLDQLKELNRLLSDMVSHAAGGVGTVRDHINTAEGRARTAVSELEDLIGATAEEAKDAADQILELMKLLSQAIDEEDANAIANCLTRIRSQLDQMNFFSEPVAIRVSGDLDTNTDASVTAQSSLIGSTLLSIQSTLQAVLEATRNAAAGAGAGAGRAAGAAASAGRGAAAGIIIEGGTTSSGTGTNADGKASGQTIPADDNAAATEASGDDAASLPEETAAEDEEEVPSDEAIEVSGAAYQDSTDGEEDVIPLSVDDAAGADDDLYLPADDTDLYDTAAAGDDAGLYDTDLTAADDAGLYGTDLTAADDAGLYGTDLTAADDAGLYDTDFSAADDAGLSDTVFTGEDDAGLYDEIVTGDNSLYSEAADAGPAEESLFDEEETEAEEDVRILTLSSDDDINTVLITIPEPRSEPDSVTLIDGISGIAESGYIDAMAGAAAGIGAWYDAQSSSGLNGSGSAQTGISVDGEHTANIGLTGTTSSDIDASVRVSLDTELPNVDALTALLEELLADCADILDADTLALARDILDDLSFEMPDARPFYTAFNDLLNALAPLDDDIAGITDTAAADFKAVTDQMNKILETFFRDVQDMTIPDPEREGPVKNASFVDPWQSNEGAIAGCLNCGMVSGDTNVGGIAGSVSYEDLFDAEDLVDLSGYILRDSSKNIFAAVRECENRGTVSAKKTAAGGIAGELGYGIVTRCVSSGQIAVDEGEYCGGVAGRSDAAITLCQATNLLSGNDYTGGIAGKADTVLTCVSYSEVEGIGPYQGAIAGWAEGEVTDNLYYDRGLGGVDGVSFSGSSNPFTDEDITVPEAGLLPPSGFQAEAETEAAATGETEASSGAAPAPETEAETVAETETETETGTESETETEIESESETETETETESETEKKRGLFRRHRLFGSDDEESEEETVSTETSAAQTEDTLLTDAETETETETESETEKKRGLFRRHRLFGSDDEESEEEETVSTEASAAQTEDTLLTNVETETETETESETEKKRGLFRRHRLFGSDDEKSEEEETVSTETLAAQTEDTLLTDAETETETETESETEKKRGLFRRHRLFGSDDEESEEETVSTEAPAAQTEVPETESETEKEISGQEESVDAAASTLEAGAPETATQSGLAGPVGADPGSSASGLAGPVGADLGGSTSGLAGPVGPNLGSAPAAASDTASADIAGQTGEDSSSAEATAGTAGAAFPETAGQDGQVGVMPTDPAAGGSEAAGEEAGVLPSENGNAAASIGTLRADEYTNPDAVENPVVTFMVGDSIVAQQIVPFGGSVSELPAVENDGDDYWVWDEFDQDTIYSNITVTGSYHRPLTTLSALGDPPRFLVEGIFYDGQELEVVETLVEGDNKTATGEEEAPRKAASVTVTNYDAPLRVRMKAAEGGTLYKVKDGKKKETIDYEVDGSYLVFELENGGSVLYEESELLIRRMPLAYKIAAGAGCVLLLLILILLVRHHRKKKKARKEAKASR